MIPIILLAVLIVFGILNITPGNPARIILGSSPDITQDMIDQLNHDLGVDRPVLVRYFDYIFHLIQGDFGTSYRSGAPVLQTLLRNFPTTFKLALFSVIMSALIGIPLGILSAVKRYSLIDTTLTVTALIFASIPGFWLGILLILFFTLQLHVLPSSGIGSFRHYIMPMLTLALPSASYLLRYTRTMMLETLRQDYIRTAKAKGASQNRVIYLHALRNALLPIVTSLGMNFAMLLGGALITEVVFGLPGIGNTILLAMTMRDTPIIMASTVLLSFMFMIIILTIDILYAYIDPRIKAQFR
jgi:peptide/nickel transport system permease protein